MATYNLDQEQLSSEGIQTQNIVAKLDLDIELDLSYLSSQLTKSNYDPEQAPSLIFRVEDLPTVLITKSGALLFTGGDSMELILSAYECIARELAEVGVKPLKSKEEIEIQNVVSTLELPTEVDLHTLSINLGIENLEYEPEQFPGLVYRISDGPVTLIFSSGKVVITGARSTQDVLSAAESVRSLIPT